MGYLQMQLFVEVKNQDELYYNLERYCELFIELGFDATSLREWIRSFTWDSLNDYGFADTFTWSVIKVDGEILQVAPNICGFAADVDPKINTPWLECNILFTSEDLSFNNQDWRYKPDVGSRLWKLIKMFANTFTNRPVFLTDAIGNGKPWYALKGSNGDLWAFDLALIPVDCIEFFRLMPSTHKGIYIENGLGIVRGDAWIVLPWNNP